MSKAGCELFANGEDTFDLNSEERGGGEEGKTTERTNIYLFRISAAVNRGNTEFLKTEILIWEPFGRGQEPENSCQTEKVLFWPWRSVTWLSAVEAGHSQLPPSLRIFKTTECSLLWTLSGYQVYSTVWQLLAVF